ncbi:MAG TPA: tripartite tricarboxylate transporter substrate binding protein [Eoetvoesiella sp.]
MSKLSSYIPNTDRRRVLQLLCLSVLTVFFSAPVIAKTDSYPDRPIKIVVPWPAGGATDLAARRFAVPLSDKLGTSIVIENRPGATGMIGTGTVARSPADGYTLVLASAETHAINPFTYNELPYDPVKDFIPIAAFASNPYSIVARTDLPAKTTKDLVTLIKKSPGKYSYSSASLGSASQIVMEMFKAEAGLDILHVPFQGEAPAVTALMGGQVDMMILPAGRAQNFRQSGKVKVYAVTMDTRFAGMPDVPTLKEEGFDAIQIANWFSLMAPAGTPQPIINKLADAIEATLRLPETSAALTSLGLGVFKPMKQADFAKFITSERTRWGNVIKQAKIHVGK